MDDEVPLFIIFRPVCDFSHVLLYFLNISCVRFDYHLVFSTLQLEFLRDGVPLKILGVNPPIFCDFFFSFG